MTPRDFALELVANAFGNGEECIVATKLFDYLARYGQSTRHINLQLIRQLTNDLKFTDVLQRDVTIFRTLNYLSGDRISCLKAHFELIDGDADPLDMNIDDLNAIADGINPVSGQEDADIKNKVFVYYSPVPSFFGTAT